jgi:hypothetical protein
MVEFLLRMISGGRGHWRDRDTCYFERQWSRSRNWRCRPEQSETKSPARRQARRGPVRGANEFTTSRSRPADVFACLCC